jgi:hypothetical protein
MFQLQLEKLRRQKDAPVSGRLKPSVFDLEKRQRLFWHLEGEVAIPCARKWN